MTPFKCEACGLEGEVRNPKNMERVACPNCNALYLYWPEGRKFGEPSEWKCVVRPIFAEEDKNDSRGA